MTTVLIVLISIISLLIIIYFVEPFILALLFSWVLSIFVRNPPYVDVDEEFPEGKILKDNWAVIKKELDTLLENIDKIPMFHEIDGLQKGISAKDGVPWRTFIMKGFNAWLPNNAKMVPETSKLIEQIPRVSLAMFSIIEGGKHIPPHYGFFKSVLRYHLAMIIPEGECFIRVGGEDYSWSVGEHTLFDDTYRHEVFNKTSERRVVLFLDILRDKDLPRPMKAMNKWMFNLLQKSKKLQAAAKKAEVSNNI